MAEEQGKETGVSIQPGQLAPYDYSHEENAKLTPDAQTALKELVRKSSTRESASRRFEIEQSWEARLFDRGYQFLLPRKGGGWQLPQEATGLGAKAQLSITALETNIYTPYETIITSALTRQIPKVKWQPKTPDSASDITAAEAAEDYEKVFSRNNDLPTMHTDMARYLWTDGRVLLYTRHVKDAQRFGYEEQEEGVVPEDENGGAKPSNNLSAEAEGNQSGGLPDETETVNGSGNRPDSPSDNGQSVSGVDSATSDGQSGQSVAKVPLGQEIVSVFGKLEHKLPMNTKNLSECDFVSVSQEFNVAIVKATFPDIAEKIIPSSGLGESELDRIARINCSLALAASYVSGDSTMQDCTVTRTWFRPAAFMGVAEQEEREELLKAFPEGCLVVHAGQEFAFARKECIDDHLTLLHATRGDGQNRAGLGAWLISPQKRVNNWIDLINDFFISTVPRKHYNSSAFNIEALKKQTNVPGDSGPFKADPTLTSADQYILMEQTPQHQPELPAFIDKFIGEIGQLVTGGYPALAGGDTGSNDTLGGIAMQRDQAMGRLGTVWHDIQGATARYHKQAVQCAARCRNGQIKESVPGEDSLIIELEDLKGNVLCYPETDSSFPESWSERQQRFTALFADAAKNPVIMQLLSLPKNLKVAKDAVGLADFDIPQADSVDKQLGEFEILMKSGPMPNPQLVQLQQLMQQAGQDPGIQQDQQKAAMFQQMQQAAETIPQFVSTVPVDEQCDDHDAEGQTCLEFINSPKGRKLKNGSDEDKAGFANIRTHYLEHDKISEAKKQAAAQAAQKMKVGESMNYKDLPPDGQVQMAGQAGIKLDPQALEQKQQQENQAKQQAALSVP